MNLFYQQPRAIELRPYQVDAVERLREGIRAGKRRQILVAPTAFGKTECAAHIIQQSLEKGARSWFVVDRVSLVDQTSERFANYGIDHGIMQADHWLTDSSKPVQIISAQTLEHRTVQWFPDLIVLDEAHCQRKKVMEIIDKSGKVSIGLTATPFTAGMAAHWDGVVNGATVNQLLGMEFLTPLKIKACVAPDMAGVKIKRSTGEYDENESGARGVTIIGDVVQTWVEQTRKLFGGPVKTIVFSPSVKHGAELCRQFADAGYNFQQISYLDRDEGERRAKIAEFRKPDSAIDGLVSCAVLTKGFDVPDVLCGISCRPYRKSFSSHVQEMGRVMRIADGKQFGLWLDHSGNVIRFADDTAWLFENGVDSLSDAARRDSEVREVKEKTKKERFCGECGMQMSAGTFTCQSCGWERPQRGEHEIVQGELIDFDLILEASFKPRQGLRAECLKNPRGVYNAALIYAGEHTNKGPDAERKWAAGIFKGIYERWPPRSFDALTADLHAVQPDQYSLVDREVRRFRKSSRRAA